MTADLLLGIDAGLSRTKAALFDRRGRELAVAGVPGRRLQPHPQWAERDMDEAWSAAARAVHKVLALAAIDPDRIAAVGVCAAMVGAWVIDAVGRPLRPGILVADARTQPWIDAKLADDPAFLSRVFASDGCVMEPGCTLPLVRWLIDHEPDVMSRAAHVLTGKDWLRYRLTGAIATDPTEAAVAPGSARSRSRSTDMLELFRLADREALFPAVHASDSIGGRVSEAAARETGLLAGTPVAIGAGDVPCSAIASGAVEDGMACTILGTTCHNGVVFAGPVFEPENLGLLFTMPGPLWLRVMVNLAGTPNLEWAAAQLFADLHNAANAASIYQRLESMAAGCPVGADGLLYHPYLTEVGLIAPQVASGARAQFSGLAPRHTRAHLLRAVYEGVAYAIRDCYEAIGRKVTEIRLVGGGARSPFWSQMIADVMGVPVVVLEGSEFGAKGAALLAGTAIGWFPSIREAARNASAIRHRYQPDPARTDVYAAAFARYQAERESIVALARKRRSCQVC
jgi:sugar (pentulose or hexulose) kinase